MATLVGIAGTSTAPSFDETRLEQKEARLIAILRDLQRTLVAYSGGTDSAYLAWAAKQALGDNAIAVTADSASIPSSHKRDAELFASENGIRHEYIETHEFENPKYVANGPDRCFHCKDELFVRLAEYGEQRGIGTIIYGVNKDDLGDYRPGQNAARLRDVRALLVEAELTKAEIRELSRRAGLRTWDRPASACLSSRVPYGTPVTAEVVKTIESGEEALEGLGFRQYRVRYHGDLARIEIAREELPRAFSLDLFDELTRAFRSLGFQYVTLDMQGYRQGSMNEVLDLKQS